MPYPELFGWWIATITWSIAFPIAVSVYLDRHRRQEGADRHGGRFRWIGDFAFVWFLLGLLVFYILVVGRGSPLLFGLGNLFVEGLLLVYVLLVSRTGRKARKP